MNIIEDNIVTKVKEDYLITLSEAKPHMNVDIDYADDDALIMSQISIAVESAEDFCGRDIALTKNTFNGYEFCDDEITFQEASFRNMESIEYKDSEGETVTLSESDYTVMVKRTYFTIKFKESIDTDLLTVKFYTGYEAEDLPKTIKGAVLIKTNDLYDMERTSYTVGVNFRSTNAFQNLLRGHVINRW